MLSRAEELDALIAAEDAARQVRAEALAGREAARIAGVRRALGGRPGLLELTAAVRAEVAARIATGVVTQTEVARRSGVSRCQVSNILAGRRRPEAAQLDRIAAAAGVDPLGLVVAGRLAA